jgi:UDP-N-acetylglucosamine acyltransferase
MSIQIHPTSFVSKTAKLGENVEIGPFCCIGDHVTLGDCVRLISHVTVDGITKIGDNSIVFPFVSLGHAPQDRKYEGEPSQLIIGKNNKIREFVTMHAGTRGGTMVTRVGDNGLFMAGVHIAHDCNIGNNVTMANYATLGGHVIVGDSSIIGGLAGIHQFVRIGHSAIIGGMSAVESDVIPYGKVKGERANLSGLNLIGLKRGDVPRTEIDKLRLAYDILFDADTTTLAERIVQVAQAYSDQPKIMEIINFMTQESSRGMCLPG